MARKKKLENGKAVSMMFNVPAFRELIESGATLEELGFVAKVLTDYYEYGEFPEYKNIDSPVVVRTIFTMMNFIDSGDAKYQEMCERHKKSKVTEEGEEPSEKKNITIQRNEEYNKYNGAQSIENASLPF